MKTVEINDKEYFTLPPNFFDDESQAEESGFYWDDELGYWTREVV